ncbi:MAG TPA: AmmeMemoRadiSam system protein B [Williamwhitmania sp.]|nr:AmmeMemoRadiSam system protein B [Williamwhitmania sp.]
MKQLAVIAITTLALMSCSTKNEKSLADVRPVVDTVGFAHLDWQTDSVIVRTEETYASELQKVGMDSTTAWRLAICPHDDYTYVGWLYPALLKNIKAKTVIIFGVAHKAKHFNLADKLVFDSYPAWHGPYGNINPSPLREEIMKALPNNTYLVHDSLQTVEHSVESMLPFLQHYNPNVEIVSILVPYMSFSRMQEIAQPLAEAINQSMKKHNLKWGKDVALLITTDAVHYGDQDWGGKNYAPYGTDSLGYQKAVAHEHVIIDSSLTGTLTIDRAKRFFDYTVDPTDYHEYRWTWCGRYSVPMGLLTAQQLQQLTGEAKLNGELIGYANSIDHKPLPVKDLRMGKTAIATMHHWVGYAAVGYR